MKSMYQLISEYQFKQHNKDIDPRQLADYLMDNCVVHLPCKLGDVFYRPLHYVNDVDTCTVSGITIKKNGEYKIRLTSARHRSVFETTTAELGKWYFRTCEEAAAQLDK